MASELVKGGEIIGKIKRICKTFFPGIAVLVIVKAAIYQIATPATPVAIPTKRLLLSALLRYRKVKKRL